MWKRRKFRKRKPFPLVKISFLIFILIIFLLVFLIVKKGILSIKQVEVQGSVSCADEAALKNYSGLLGQNFFLVNTLKVEDKLKKKFLCVKSVDIKKLFPGKARLQVSSRNPLAVLAILRLQEASISALAEDIATPSAQQVQDYYLVDSEGVVFGKGADNLNIPPIFISNFNISLGQKLANEITDSVKILERVKILGVEVKKSLINENYFVINPDTSDQKIIFGLNNRIDIQLASLQLILDKAKIDLTKFVFIDLRFDKPVVKIAPKK